MAWYWWALIGAGCIAVAVIKITVFNKLMSRKKKNIPEDE